MLGCEQLDIAIKLMIKHRMSNYECLITKDKLFLNYNLAWVYKKKQEIELAQYYINNNLKIFNENNSYKITYKVEYYNFLWLYAELNKDHMSKLEYNNIFLQIHKYHKKMSNKRFSYGAIQKIVFNTGSDEKIINFVKKIIDTDGCMEIATDMVEDCKDLEDHIYIEVKTYLNNAIASVKVANLY